MADEVDDVDGTASEVRRHSRRDVLKKGAVGAGVAGVVWAAPEIIGLSTAPAYASSRSGISIAPCTSSDTHFDITIPCPPPGHTSLTVAPVGGTCGNQGITVDSHWAIGTPSDTTASRPNKFADITPQDSPSPAAGNGTGNTTNDHPAGWKTYAAGGNVRWLPAPPYFIFGIHRNTGNTNCLFTSADFTNLYSADSGGGWQIYNPGYDYAGSPESTAFNPVTLQKFSPAFESTADIALGYATDPNERADLSQDTGPPCIPAKIGVHLKCL